TGGVHTGIPSGDDPTNIYGQRTNLGDAARGSSGSERYVIEADQTDDVGDWRAAVIKGDFNADLTGRLLTQAFASEIEKHVAIQAVALVAGNCDKLSNWHWRVWRKPDEYGYPLSGKERYPGGLSPMLLNSSLHKYVLALA